MRLLLLSATFHPVIGGAESYALNLARGLGDRGHVVRVVTDTVDGHPHRQEMGGRVVIERLHRYQARFNSPGHIRWEEMQFGLCEELREIADDFRPDVIMSNSLDLCVPAKWLSLGVRRPWVATFHEQAPERTPLGVARLELAYGMLKPEAIIAGSQFYLARAHQYGSTDRARLIYHGIDTATFRFQPTSAEVRSHYHIPPTTALVVSAGRLKPRKGFVDLLHAVRSLRVRGVQLAVVIAGTINSASAEHRDELLALSRDPALVGHVRIDEGLTHESMPWLLSGADLVVQASTEEGLGLSVIEAMACARPVIATRIPGFVEVVTSDDIAWLVEPSAPEQLASCIADLLADSDRCRETGRRARLHVERHFSLDSMVTATASVLQSVCDAFRQEQER